MKFFYYIGVYSFCVGIHKTIQSLPFALREVNRAVKELIDIIDEKEEENKTNEKEKQREHIEKNMKEQKRTMNRIGF